MDPNETCSDSVICGNAGGQFDPVVSSERDPLTKLLEDWGYTHLLPVNVVEWPELSYALHVAIGVYLFSSGKNNDILLCENQNFDLR